MTWYAESPARRGRQVAGDAAAVLWVVAWVLVARWVFDLVRLLAAPADPLRRAGSSWGERLEDVAALASGVPIVGTDLAGSFTSAAGVGADITAAGQRLDDGVTAVAWVVSLLLLSLPLALALGYLALRWRWARQATAMARTRDDGSSQDLLALRALVHQPPARLRRVASDPLAGWRAGDPGVVDALADLELRRFGLRLRRPVTGEVSA
jgi:hypothetical protein